MRCYILQKLVSVIQLGLQDIFMGYSTSTSTDFRQRDCCDGGLLLYAKKHGGGPALTVATLCNSLATRHAKPMSLCASWTQLRFQHNKTPCPSQQLCEIYPAWAFEELSHRRWWPYSLWHHVHFM